MFKYFKFVFLYVNLAYFIPLKVLFFNLSTQTNLYEKSIQKVREYMKISRKFTGEKEISAKIILVNHRTFIDPAFLGEGICSVSRKAFAYMIVPIESLFGFQSEQLIVINRGKTSRTELFHEIEKKIKKGKTVAFYPEGTRKKHTVLPDKIDDIELKIGGIKMLYENNLSFQIQINKGNENVFSEKTMSFNYNTLVETYISEKYEVENWKNEEKTFDEFLHDVKSLWKEAWYKVYDKPADSNK